MQYRRANLIIGALGLISLPLLWFACTTQPAGSDATVIAKLNPEPLEHGFNATLHPFIKTYCVDCHGGEKPKADLDLSRYATLTSVTRDLPRWDQVLERLKAVEMPPDDAEKQPTDADRRPVIAWLDSMHAAEVQRTAGDPGIVLARRLSNAEYDYTIRDLTGIDIRPTKEFPVDPANAAGFDNSGESLSMSPAMVKKYLDAARLVADHLVFTPDGFTFAPYTVTTEEDRNKYAVNRVVDFYTRQRLDYADFFAAAWRFKNRGALGRKGITLAAIAQEAKLSPKYLATVWTALNAPGEDIGPLAALQLRWRKLPPPANGSEPETLLAGCVAMRELVTKLRPLVKMEFPNLVPDGYIVAPGSQTMVLWKDEQYATHRSSYAGNALQLDPATLEFAAADPLLEIPPDTDQAALWRYDGAFKRFCAVFPDAFYVSERARMFLTNQREIESDLRGHRLLTAGFHSQMGYFRDDKPLYEMVLDANQQRELDRLWQELDFIAQAPVRQFREFMWFERAEPPSLMFDSSFAAFRSEDDDITSEAKLKRLAEVYATRVEKTAVNIDPSKSHGNIPLSYKAPAPGTTGPPPPGYVQIKVSEPALQAIREYFPKMNARIRALEKAERDAEPLQLMALVDFAGRAFRRPLAAAERDDLLSFYRSLREQSQSHQDAIRDCVVSVLMSPTFTYRFDLPVNAGKSASAGVQPLSDYELASRLSYFLWSSMPDRELLVHAAAGDLHRPAVLVAQARRMLQDDRVRGLATEFGGNWLDIRRFEEHNAVDRERFPAFTNELREAMFEEPIRFTTDLVRRDGSVLDFIYGDYTFVNAALAQHYGMPAPAAPEEWVRIDDAKKYQRGGLLPMAAFLTKNAPGLRTSPVKRGHWVVTKLLGERIPAPPPNVPVLPTDETKLGDLTLRQTLAKHREDKTCASCHNKFDSFGLVFEGFGPVGETRTADLAGRPAETNAIFPDGSEGNGLAGLQTYFRTKVQNEFLDNLCRKLMVFALGRSLLPSDDPVIAAMRQKLSVTGYRFDGLVGEIVTSRQFLNKRVSHGTEGYSSQ